MFNKLEISKMSFFYTDLRLLSPLVPLEIQLISQVSYTLKNSISKKNIFINKDNKNIKNLKA